MPLRTRSIKLVGLTFVAVLALGAVMASSAFARPLIHFTAEGATTGTGGRAIIEIKKGVNIECEKSSSHANTTGLDKAHMLIEIEKCKGPSGSTCTTTEGNEKAEVGTSGNIHVLALALLGSDTAPPLDLPAVLITPENKADEKANVTFFCQIFGLGSAMTVRGSIIGLVKNVTTGKGGVIVTLAKNGVGVPQDLHFWDESEEGVLDFLEFEAKGIESFAFEQGSIETTELLLSTGTPPILIET